MTVTLSLCHELVKILRIRAHFKVYKHIYKIHKYKLACAKLSLLLFSSKCGRTNAKERRLVCMCPACFGCVCANACAEQNFNWPHTHFRKYCETSVESLRNYWSIFNIANMTGSTIYEFANNILEGGCIYIHVQNWVSFVKYTHSICIPIVCWMMSVAALKLFNHVIQQNVTSNSVCVIIVRQTLKSGESDT